MPDSSGYFLIASSTVRWCSGAQCSKNDRRRLVHDRSRRNAIDLNAILDALLREGFRESNNRRIDCSYSGESRLRVPGCKPREQDNRTPGSFQGIPGSYGKATGSVKLQRHTVVPLRVCHLKEVNLRHSPGDIHERVDPAEATECFVHDFFGRCWLAEVERKHETFSSEGLRLLGCFLQVRLVSCDQDKR